MTKRERRAMQDALRELRRAKAWDYTGRLDPLLRRIVLLLAADKGKA